MSGTYQITHGLPDHLRHPAARLYLQAFWGKFRLVLGPSMDRAVKCFAPRLRLDHAIVATQDTRLLGLAGFQDDKGSFLDATLRDLQHAYGWVSGTLRGLAIGVLERTPAPGTLLMDGIMTTPEARGQGIGTALLTAIADLARNKGCTSVRLDVIDTNPRARALYEREGFIPTQTQRLGLLKPVFGFSHSTTMIRTLDKGQP